MVQCERGPWNHPRALILRRLGYDAFARSWQCKGPAVLGPSGIRCQTCRLQITWCGGMWTFQDSHVCLIAHSTIGLRLLQHDHEGLVAVSSLKHDEMLYAWEHGYGRGKWSDERAVAALKHIRAVRQQATQAAAAKRKAAEATAAAKRKAMAAAAKKAAGAAKKAAAAALAMPITTAAPTSSPTQPLTASVPAATAVTVAAGSKVASKRPMVAAPHAGLNVQVKRSNVKHEKQENEAVVERTLNNLFSTGRDDVGFDELWQALRKSRMPLPRASIEAALDAMEAANKVMHRESRIHLI